MSKDKLLRLKATIPSNLKDFIDSYVLRNGVTARLFMTTLVEDYRINLIRRPHKVMDDALLFMNDSTETKELSIQIKSHLKKKLKIAAAEHGVTEKVFIIAALKSYINILNVGETPELEIN